MLSDPGSKPLLVPLNHMRQQRAPFREEGREALGLLVCLVHRLIQSSMGEFAPLSAVELLMQRIKHLMPAVISIGLDQGLFPLPLRRVALLPAHLLVLVACRPGPYRAPSGGSSLAVLRAAFAPLPWEATPRDFACRRGS